MSTIDTTKSISKVVVDGVKMELNPKLQAKTAIQNGLVVADAGYDGLSSVNVDVDIPEPPATFMFGKIYNISPPDGVEVYGLNQNFFTCFFVCDTAKSCKIKATVNLTVIHEIDYTTTLETYLNGEVIDSRPFALNNETKTFDFSFEHTFTPTQINNNILFKSTETNSSKRTCRVQLNFYKIEIFGKDVTILNKNQELKVFPYSGGYYLSKNYAGEGYGKVLNTGETEIDTGYSKLPRIVYDIDAPDASTTDKQVYDIYNYSFLPFISSYSDGAYQIDNSVNNLICCFSNTSFTYMSASNNIPQHFSSLKYIACGSDYEISTPANGDTTMRHVCFVRMKYDYNLCIANGERVLASAAFVKLNGETLPNKWVFNTPVMRKNWQSTSATDNKYFFIGTNEFGHNYFFEQQEATYMLDLGFGTQTSATLQEDGKVFVYMNNGENKIIKKVLALNSTTNQYEIQSESELIDGYAYIEGNGNDYFLHNGTKWIYVPVTEA